MKAVKGHIMRTRTLAGPVAFVCAIALAGCSATSSGSSGGRGGGIDPDLTTDSRIIFLNENGSLPDVGIDPKNSRSLTRKDDGGFAYQIGRVVGEKKFLGVAGIAPNTRVGDAPTIATASYDADYDLAYADRTRIENPVSGKITLNADFNNGTLKGQSGGLAVDGTITGQNIGGTASYRGVDAKLTGRIGEERAVGAFAGHNDDAVVTGGFIGKREGRTN
jgi:hypothetical protein